MKKKEMASAEELCRALCRYAYRSGIGKVEKVEWENNPFKETIIWNRELVSKLKECLDEREGMRDGKWGSVTEGMLSKVPKWREYLEMEGDKTEAMMRLERKVKFAYKAIKRRTDPMWDALAQRKRAKDSRKEKDVSGNEGGDVRFGLGELEKAVEEATSLNYGDDPNTMRRLDRINPFTEDVHWTQDEELLQLMKESIRKGVKEVGGKKMVDWGAATVAILKKVPKWTQILIDMPDNTTRRKYAEILKKKMKDTYDKRKRRSTERGWMEFDPTGKNIALSAKKGGVS